MKSWDARQNGLKVIEDCAQALGGTSRAGCLDPRDT